MFFLWRIKPKTKQQCKLCLFNLKCRKTIITLFVSNESHDQNQCPFYFSNILINYHHTTTTTTTKMKLFAISILKIDPAQTTEPLVCSSAVDVSDVGFFQRGAAKEFLIFLARTVTKRTPAMSRLQVNEQGNSLYSQSFAGGKLAVCVTCDKEYNSRVAFNLCTLVGEKFMSEFRGRWETVDKDNMLSWPELETILKKYQNPAEADKIMKIQNDINSTKTVMVDAIDQVLARGEKIDDLVVRSQDLSDSSKVFYSTAKKTNSWCNGCVIA